MKTNLLTEIVAQVNGTVNQSRSVRMQIADWYERGLIDEDERMEHLYNAVLSISGRPSLAVMRACLANVIGWNRVNSLTRSNVEISFDKEFGHA